LKISNKQLDAIVDLEWSLLRQRVEKQWPGISSELYPELRPLHPNDVRYWITQATLACRQWGIDDEQAAIALALDVLSAATLRLPKSFIQDMARYLLESADDDADHTAAQQWIRWTLFEQHELMRHKNEEPCHGNPN